MKFLKWILLILLLVDWGHTYLQCYERMTVDGDMIGLVLPSQPLQKVLEDPLGINVLLHDEVYNATNRYFSHVIMMHTFRNLPLFFQNFTNPIDSIYVSLAFASTLVQVVIILLLAFYTISTLNIINKKNNLTFTNLVIAMVIITPLFQFHGYNNYMGILNLYLTYTFSYALPLIFVLLFFLFFYTNLKKFNFIHHLLLVIISLNIAFGGPIGPPIILISCPIIILYQFFRNHKPSGSNFFTSIKNSINKINKDLLFHFSIIFILCLYSLYIGRNNAENLWYQMPIEERYKLLPMGIWNILTEKLGPLLLIILIILNILILKLTKNNSVKVISRIFLLISVCCIFYLILLPLGGFRGYRPFIIRNDTFSPVSLSLIWMYSVSAFVILHLLNKNKKLFYIIVLVVVTFIYTFADRRIYWNINQCEKDALSLIVNSEEEIVELNHWCSVMDWERYFDYNQSRAAALVLMQWNVIDRPKFFYFVQ